MNLQQLFQTQEILDQHIVDNHPELKGQDNLPWKVLAFQVELGECANEWRGFKKWSNDQKPRIKERIECETCVGTGDSNAEANMEMMMEGKDGYPYEPCEDCNETGISGYRNPLLEEYVDCLHFLLSIGLEIDCTNIEITIEEQEENTIDAFLSVFEHCIMMDVMPSGQLYANLFGHFVSLGIMLGFTWSQIEQAYFEKNKVNHERQKNGY